MTREQIVLFALLGGGLLALIIISEIRKNYSLNGIKRKTVGDGQYGTARWATNTEILQTTHRITYEPEQWRIGKNLPTEPGIIINLVQHGRKRTAYVDTTDNHVMMVSGPGGGKTTTFMYPNIEYALACGISFACTDSKGDILRMYGKLCEEYKYTCMNINFRFPLTSDPYNFLMLVNKYTDQWKSSGNLAYKSRAERYAKSLARSIIRTKGFDGGGQNAYFYDSAEGVITAVILMVSQYCDREERHIVSVFKVLLELLKESKITASGKDDSKDGKKKSTRTKLHEILDLLPDDDKIKWFAGSAPQTGGAQFSSVMTTAMSRLLSFIDSETEGIICHDTKVTIEDICKKPVAIFITFPEEDETKHVLVSMLLTQLINEAITYADEYCNGKLDRRLYIFADEFGIFPYMSNIVGMFGSSRSRNVLLVPCIQSPAQLKITYGADGEKIIRDCCQTVIFGGFSPMSDTAVEFSRLLDTQTVASGSVSINNNGNSLSGNSNSGRSMSMISRPLMSPDELRVLPFGKWVVTRRSEHPFQANLPRYDQWGIHLDNPYTSVQRSRSSASYASCDELYVNICRQFGRRISPITEDSLPVPENTSCRAASDY